MRVRGAKYANHAHQHGIGASPHIERGGCHPDRIDSNHLKSARTNSAHSEPDPETKTRTSPRCRTSSTLEFTAVVSRTSDSSRTNSDLMASGISSGFLDGRRGPSRNSETQRRKRLAFTPFARATLQFDVCNFHRPIQNLEKRDPEWIKLTIQCVFTERLLIYALNHSADFHHCHRRETRHRAHSLRS